MHLKSLQKLRGREDSQTDTWKQFDCYGVISISNMIGKRLKANTIFEGDTTYKLQFKEN